MIFYLPQDVNEIMYEFLLFSLCHSKYFCISKKTTKNINSCQMIKKYKLLKERINMAKEDDNNKIKNIRKDDNLYKLWNQYHLHKWYNTTNYKNLWKKGDYVDAYDFVKGWCPARIIKAYIERKTDMLNKELTIEYRRLYEIKFLGWADQFIEKVEVDKLASLGKYTINPLKMYESISRDCSGNQFYWTLCKQEKDKRWKMCRIIERIIEDDCIKLLSFIGTIYKVKKNNIENMVRHITDASTFFSIESEYCFFKRRTFEI
jgi:hypothetical protein